MTVVIVCGKNNDDCDRKVRQIPVDHFTKVFKYWPGYDVHRFAGLLVNVIVDFNCVTDDRDRLYLLTRIRSTKQ